MIQLRDLPSDFQISIEVYALQTKKEKMDHNQKYHIRKESSKMRLTPKKLINKQVTEILNIILHITIDGKNFTVNL